MRILPGIQGFGVGERMEHLGDKMLSPDLLRRMP
jgi:hypothetical protein